MERHSSRRRGDLHVAEVVARGPHRGCLGMKLLPRALGAAPFPQLRPHAVAQPLSAGMHPTLEALAPAGMLTLSGAVGPFLPSSAQLCAAAVLLTLVGLPHGATDRRLALSIKGCIGSSTSAGRVDSAHHWGQSHGSRPSIRRTFLGASIIASIVLSHKSASLHLLQLLCGAKSNVLLQGVQIYGLVGAAGYALLSAAAVLRRSVSWTARDVLKECLLLAAVCFVCLRNNLLWSFTSYFCIGHSLEAWREAAQRFGHGRRGGRLLYLETMGFTSLFLIGIGGGVAAYLFGVCTPSCCFAALLAASLPHVLLHDWIAPALQSWHSKRVLSPPHQPSNQNETYLQAANQIDWATFS
uniref:Beta-carotene 15,15'-dioxygenase n=1 Tax=Chrysotila carterae TaxID=13221 RepID=A0A7S4B7F0_CHRCT